MESLRPHSRLLVLRLLLVAAVAVSHCCLMGHAAWAADGHGGASLAHVAPGHAMSAQWQGTAMAPMVCDGAHAVASARLAVPVPTSAAAPVAAHLAPASLGAGSPQPARADRARPDPLPPSRATLQIFRI